MEDTRETYRKLYREGPHLADFMTSGQLDSILFKLEKFASYSMGLVYSPSKRFYDRFEIYIYVRWKGQEGYSSVFRTHPEKIRTNQYNHIMDWIGCRLEDQYYALLEDKS